MEDLKRGPAGNALFCVNHVTFFPQILASGCFYLYTLHQSII